MIGLRRCFNQFDIVGEPRRDSMSDRLAALGGKIWNLSLSSFSARSSSTRIRSGLSG